MLSAILAILLVSYSIPFGAFIQAFAQNEAFTLQIVEDGVPVANQKVTVENNAVEEPFYEEGTTDANGKVEFNLLTQASFAENNDFTFTVGERSYLLEGLREGTTDSYVYDIATGNPPIKVDAIQTPSEPTEPEEPTNPGEGTAPENPEDPGSTDPEEPVDPEEPTEPEEPTTPEEPTPPVPENHYVSVHQTGAGNVIMNDKEYKRPVKVEKGDEVALEVSPKTYYEIESVTIITKGKKEKKIVSDKQFFQETLSISKDTEIHVVFTPIIHSISLEQTGSGKVKISHPNNGEKVELEAGKGVAIEAGTEVEVEIIPEEGFEIHTVAIENNGEKKEKEIKDKRYFKDQMVVSTDTKIYVEFSVKEYTITFNSYKDGVIKDHEDQILNSAGGSIVVLHDQDSFFTVYPNEGYHVERMVIEDGREYKETITDFSRLEKVKNSEGINGFKYPFKKVKKNYTVTVTFTLNTYDVKASVPSGNGVVTLNNEDGHVNVHHGSPVNVTMTPLDGYRVASLKVNDKVISSDIENDPTFEEDDYGNITYTVNPITKNTEIVVEFEEAPVLEASWENYLTTEMTPDSGILIEDPILEGAKGKHVQVYSKDTNVKINPVDPFNKLNLNENYFSRYFIGWEKGYSLNESYSIHQFLVKTNGWKNVLSVHLTEPLMLLWDKKKPEVSNIQLNNKTVSAEPSWYAGAVTVTLEANDVSEKYEDVTYSAGIDKVYYTKGSKDNATAETTLEATYDAEKKQYTFDTVDENYQGIYSIWTVDKAGNESTVQTVQILIDKDAPTLDQTNGNAVVFEEVQHSWGAKLVNFFTFGTYFNEEIKVTVKAVDDASGMKDILLIARDSKGNVSEKIVPTLNQAESDITNGVAVFHLDDDKFKGTFEVVVTDHVNNYNKEPYEVTSDNSNILSDKNREVMFDKQAPAVDIQINEGEDRYDGYYNQDVSIDVNVEDGESGLHKVLVEINGELVDGGYDLFKEENAQVKPLTYSYNTSDFIEKINEDGSYNLSVFVLDNAGNESQVSKKIFIDKNAPTLVNEDGKAISFELIHDEKWAKGVNYLSFGTFFNKKVEMTVKAVDDVSGLKSIVLNSSDASVPQVEATDVDLENGIAKFTLDVDQFKGTFNVEVVDMVNHKEVYEVSKDNSDIVSENQEVMIEKNAPNAKITVVPDSTVSSNGGNQYNGDVTFEAVVEDTESGIGSDSILINNQEIAHDYSEEAFKQDRPILYPIATNKKLANKDGSYVVSLEVFDNAGNKNTAEETVYIDRTKPIITDFTFATKEKNGKYSEAAEVDKLNKEMELTEYGYYFNKPTRVTVVTEDPKVDYEFTSGVKSMTIYLKDHDKGTYYAVKKDGSLQEIAETAIDSIVPITTNGTVTFDVPKSFKGQIFAKAADHVNNSGAFETPDGTVVEDKAQHSKETNIEFDKAETSYKDSKDLELYNKDVTVDLTVMDSYSGLSEIEWSVIAPYDTGKNQQGIVKINNDRTYQAGSDTQGWKQTKTDKNLVTEMKKTIKVRHNSNDIVLKVKMTDRAGNTSEEEIKFSIDKTAPTIDVTYDNNSSDPEFNDFYQENRTATIVVTERNFSPKDVEYLITNKDGATPKLLGWTSKVNKNDPDKTTHTAIVRYTADGDYSFDIKYKDDAANQAAAFKQDTFTLDKTKPEISVTYNNNAGANGNYYNASRTATITITEHNFETGRIQVTGTASDGVAFPGVSSWSSRGDVHTATIHYEGDALYSFDIAYTDKAGNIAADYQMDEFYVDQTAPELTITGVEDQSANNGDVAPVIAYSDKNFNKEAVSISLTGANRGPVALAGAYANAENGQVYTFNNFENEKEVDDLYTLSATLVDFAGNETTKTIMFSINRFGSVYVFDESLKGIDGKYVQQEQDIVLTETNVDNLKHETIGVKVTKNGTPSDLVEGTDYTVTESGGAGKWSQYKYVINKELFANDGRYTVALYSEDAAGNINETIDESKKAEISFGIDKTAPVIVPLDIESGEQYPVENKQVTVSIKDNLVLEDATIYLNGGKVEHAVEGENFTFTMASSNSKQDVKVVAVDAAGNELINEVDDLLVSTNPIVRWYNNTPLFAGSIGGIGALGLSIAAYFVFRNQRKQEDAGNEAIGG